jgi:hypothetical protein
MVDKRNALMGKAICAVSPVEDGRRQALKAEVRDRTSAARLIAPYRVRFATQPPES